MREARVGLSTGKKVTRCLLHLSKDELDFAVVLKAEDFSLSSLKTPKVEQDGEDDDPDAVTLEKIALIEMATDMMDAMYSAFLKIRLDEAAWQQETQAIRAWTKAE